jgi:hypothetical protein
MGADPREICRSAHYRAFRHDMSHDTNGREPADPPAPVEIQRSLARTITNPAVRANQAIIQWSGLAGTPFDRGLLLELEAQIAAIQAGNLDRPTAILAAHLETLNAVFNALLRSALEYRGGPHEHEKLKLAMRVQARIAATVQNLADLKNPGLSPMSSKPTSATQFR